MAAKKKQLVPEATTAAPLRAKAPRITKPKATSTVDGDVRRSSRLAVKSATQPVRRYKNGLLNLERTPSHLVHISKRNATDSPLLRIPPEIRNKVWKYAMGNQLIKSPGYSNEDTSWRTSKTGAAILRPNLRKLDLDKVGSPWAWDVYPRRSTTRMTSAFHLPEVCRQIYSETATLGYSLNTFIMPDEHLNYDNWATSLLPAYRKAIKTIEPEPIGLNYLMNSQLAKRLRRRTFPGLTRIIVSDIAIDHPPGTTNNDRQFSQQMSAKKLSRLGSTNSTDRIWRSSSSKPATSPAKNIWSMGRRRSEGIWRSFLCDRPFP